MSAPIPSVEPVTLAAGDTLKFTRSFPNYPVSDGWALSYRLISPTANAIPFTASEDPDDSSQFLVNIPAATTAGWTEGKYKLFGFVTLSPDRFKVYEGDFTILPNVATADTYDYRSNAQKMLDKVEAMILGRADRAEISYSINGRSMTFSTPEDLMKLRDRLKAEVAQEKMAGRNRKILGRFVKAR